ncbi:uncharacterized protein LOC113637002 isoform X3 [Tachysurus fulvidraco]|uniref:uncharacterized protein LOC113637002 isoform X3 n=1 Tax=Tachysurus fulvidraco TaxID=1234273 RepID=UPI001FEEA547|nr:uncharacterized protein LOC113637002 isoform X3 [Tachysurus fulvidraco]
MMKCLYLLYVVFHVAAGCNLTAQTKYEYIGLPGGSVLLLCSCSDLHTKPHTFTWMTFRTGKANDVLNDEHYRDRLQLFNNTSPGNLSLLISDLREEDAVDYRCRTEKEHRDMSIPGKGCDLYGDKHQVAINGLPGGSVQLPCSCSDLHTNPQIFTWTTNRTGHWTDVLKDELYRDRLQLFNNISPGNLSLLISNLREEDQGVYRCSTGLKEYRDIRINVEGGKRETSTRSGKTDRRPPSEQPQSKTSNAPPTSSSTTLEQGGRRETLTRSGKTDRRPPSEQPQSKTTNSPPASSSTTLKQDEQPPHSSLPLVFGIVAALLLVIVGIMAFICWKRKGGRRGKNKVTERRPKQKDQTVPDVTYSTVSHIHTAGAARVQINVEEKTEYASIVTN